MSATRKRRIVWRTALVLAALVFLPVAYLGWYAAFNWHYGRQLRLRTRPAIQSPSVLQRVFTPLYQYELTEWPGVTCARHVASLVDQQGREYRADVGAVLDSMRERPPVEATGISIKHQAVDVCWIDGPSGRIAFVSRLPRAALR